MLKMQRQFELCEHDRDFLNSRGLAWETVIHGNSRWVLVHGYPLGKGYNVDLAVVGLEIPPTYPDTQIDMVYFFPQLALQSGRAIPQITPQEFDGKVWQRWSRHRTPANPWRRGYDCVETHLLLVDEWLEREIRRAA